MEVILNASCGNSPRSQLAADMAAYLRDNNFAKVDALLSDDFVWVTPEGKSSISKVNLKNLMTQLQGSEIKVDRLIIHTAFSHGKYAAVSSISHTSNGMTFYTHDLYEFSSAGKNAKLAKLTSYSVDAT